MKSIFIFSATLLLLTFSVKAENIANSSCLQIKDSISYGKNDSLTNGNVSRLQSFLKNNGYLSGATTGYFGINTRNAVKRFQIEKYPYVDESKIDKNIITRQEDRKYLVANGFQINGTGQIGLYTRAKIAYASCHINTTTKSDGNVVAVAAQSNSSKTSSENTLTTIIPQGACYFDEAAYKKRGYKMTVTSSDSAAWISANTMTLINGKLYLLNKPGFMWNLWNSTTNKLTDAMLSCKDGSIVESGFPKVASALTEEELAIKAKELETKDEIIIQEKCQSGLFPSIYAICQPKEKRLQYLKDQFAKAKKPMSQATVNSFGPGFKDSQLAYADWNYVTVGPFVVSCDELATTYNFYWLKNPDGTVGNWSPNSNRNFYDTDGKFVGSGGALITTTQYKDKITGEGVTEPVVNFGAIGYCNHGGTVASTTTPSLNIYRTEVNNEQTLSWSTKNVSTLSYNCLDSNNKSTGDISVPVNKATSTESWASLRKGGWNGTYRCSWKANGTTVVGTESFTIGN